MRSKFVVAALSGLFMAGVAFAQSAPVAAPPADPQNILNLDLSTGGRVKILLRPDKAPYSVDRVKTLVRRHFYDGLIFHRVIEGFMAQGGDPKGTGEGGSNLPDLKAEFNDLPHVRGTMSMARAEGLDSANSQFFIMLQPNLSLDGNYTAIGRVMSGMEFVDAIEKGEPPANPSKIVHASIESDDQGAAPAAFVPPPPAAAVPASELGKKVKKAKKSKERKEQEAPKPAESAPTPAAEATPAPAPDAASPPQAEAPQQATEAAVQNVTSDEAIAKPR